MAHVEGAGLAGGRSGGIGSVVHHDDGAQPGGDLLQRGEQPRELGRAAERGDEDDGEDARGARVFNYEF
jgi:hypothetical protein